MFEFWLVNYFNLSPPTSSNLLLSYSTDTMHKLLFDRLTTVFGSVFRDAL